ncbi:hypothetical protein U1Q18_032733 [Sarracenia purpurea var. burkii]
MSKGEGGELSGIGKEVEIGVVSGPPCERSNNLCNGFRGQTKPFKSGSELAGVGLTGGREILLEKNGGGGGGGGLVGGPWQRKNWRDGGLVGGPWQNAIVHA